MRLKERFFGRQRGAEFYPSSRSLKRTFEESPHKESILAYFSKHNVSIRELFRWPKEKRGLLSDIGILRHFLAGNIVIEPFRIKGLQSNGYDVRLGEYYFAYSSPQKRNDSEFPAWSSETGLLNPLDSLDVELSWGEAQKTQTVGEFLKELWDHVLKYTVGAKDIRILEGYEGEDQVIFLVPGQMIIGHTLEFIGGRNIISTTISGKSSLGRSMIEVCSDANLGDVGFTNRWALELTNKSKEATVALLVGQPVATIQFTVIEPPIASYQGVYQTGKTLEEIKTSWKPKDLLPKMRRNA